jgi:Thrombospondin type 3 repeat
MSIKIPFVRKKISTFLALSIAILMLLSSPQLFKPLPIQASESNSASMQTAAPADGTVCPSSTVAKIVFDAEGTYSSPYREFTNIRGSFQIYSDAGGNFTQLYGGNINGAAFIPTRAGLSLELTGALEGNYNNTTCVPTGSYQIQIVTPCGNPAPITVNLENKPLGDFNGRVGCDPPPPQSSMAAGSSQDGDGDSDGIPDSSDNCPNNSHHRCFKEGDNNTTTTSSTTSTDQQQQSSSPSSSPMTGTTQDSDSGSSGGSSTDGNSRDGDGDGIPDSSDNCPNHSHHRCFKVGDTSTTTTSTDEQQPSSSNGNGNQTRQ